MRLLRGLCRNDSGEPELSRVDRRLVDRPTFAYADLAVRHDRRRRFSRRRTANYHGRRRLDGGLWRYLMLLCQGVGPRISQDFADPFDQVVLPLCAERRCRRGNSGREDASIET